MRPLVSLSFTFAIATAQKCFFPNGGPVGSDSPCNPNLVVSSCCFDNQACLSNGLCVSDPHDAIKARIHRGTCTDKTWKSGNCPRQCLDVDNNGVPVYSCNSTATDSYCCYDGCECNNSSFETFEFPGIPEEIYTVTIIGESYTRSSTTSISSTSSSTAATVTGNEHMSSSQPSTPASTSSPTPTAGAGASTHDSPPIDSSSSPATNLGLSLGLGLGLGLPLIALIGVLAFILWRRHERSAAYPSAIELAGNTATGLYAGPSTKYAHIAEVEVGNYRSELNGVERAVPVELPDSAMPEFSARKA